MELETVRFVPKVHPASRLVEPDDPMSLRANAVAGDPDLMFRVIVEEFCRLGWDVEHILGLFRNPSYPVLYGLGIALGREVVRERVEAMARFHGLFSLKAAVVEAPDDEPEPDLVQIGPFGPGECHHGYGL
jgi:hypothetical protein